MLSPRGQSGLEAKILASEVRPWSRSFGLGLASIMLSYYVIWHFSCKNRVKFGNFVIFFPAIILNHNHYLVLGLGLDLDLEVLASFNVCLCYMQPTSQTVSALDANRSKTVKNMTRLFRGSVRTWRLKSLWKGGVVRVTPPRNFLALNVYNSKTVKAVNLKSVHYVFQSHKSASGCLI